MHEVCKLLVKVVIANLVHVSFLQEARRKKVGGKVLGFFY